MKRIFILATILFGMFLTGCTRIETGTVGLRVDMSRQIQGNELQPGTWNQTLIGSVLEFQVRSIPTGWENLTPQTADNSTLKDFDVNIVYEINPSSVSELWTTQSRSFHTYEHGDYMLMRNYMSQVLSSAAAKAVRKYKALEVADNRENIEKSIHDIMVNMLTEEKLEKALTISQVRVTSATPADDIVASANNAVRAQNDLKTKQVEVQIAQQEAIRIQTLNSNSQAIPYMNAMAQMEIAKAIREGKVHTIVVPQDFKGIVNVK
jgi:Flp pilus assembly protein TadG